MTLTKRERDAIYKFLTQKTTYDVDLLLAKKSDSQIVNIYNRIKDAIIRYPLDIIAYLEQHPEIKTRYSQEQLQQMSYNRLAKIRENFKIRKKAKKVTSTSFANNIYDDALNVVNQKETRDLCFDLVANNKEREPLILSSSEVEELYGDDFDIEFLEKQGIILENIQEFQRKNSNEEDVRFDQIDAILKSNVSINDQNPTFEQLYSLDKSTLENLYQLSKILKK